ncbi:MAG: hypothetical protein BZ138_01110 [Methanosphaera sp. rholeuAM270]|nr:MAG: hypothetical protein BZ138_01110 [Methanosphaera sp. rholeuAM270]
MKTKKIFLVFLFAILLVGVSYAAEDVSDDTFDTTEVVHTDTTTNGAQCAAETNDKDQIIKQNNNKSMKASSNTRTSTKLTLNKISQKTYKDDVTITGKFMDKNGKILKNTIIKVKLNGKTYNAKTNYNGVYTKKLKANKVGTNNVLVSYEGNYYYKASSNRTTFSTIKRATKLTINQITTTYNGDTVKISGKFTDNTGAIIKNTMVKLNINGKTYNAKTNSNGVYTLNYKTTKSGTNKVIASYAGNDNYNKVSVQKTFSVTPVHSVTMAIKQEFTVKYINGDPFCTLYETDYAQYDPGVYAEIDERGLSAPPVNKIIKAKFFFKNSRGNIITRTVYPRYKTAVETSLISGYRPYKVDIYYCRMTETERYNYWYGYY